MARIFITGSTEGLGRAAALALLDDGHQVVLHARNPSRAGSLELEHTTQVWLAVSSEPDAMGSGGYWHRRRRQAPAPAVSDVGFQDGLLDHLTRLTGVRLP